jgi:hypothetical protein
MKAAAVGTEAAVLQARLAQVRGEVEMRRKTMATFAEEIEMKQGEAWVLQCVQRM